MKPYFEKDGITLYHGDCREILPTLRTRRRAPVAKGDSVGRSARGGEPMNTTNLKPCPQCRGTGWCPGEELDEEIICSKCGGRGTLRNTTNPAPQEKNSAPLLSGVDCVQTTQAEGFPPARNIGSLAGEPCSDQSGPRGGANHHG